MAATLKYEARELPLCVGEFPRSSLVFSELQGLFWPAFCSTAHFSHGELKDPARNGSIEQPQFYLYGNRRTGDARRKRRRLLVRGMSGHFAVCSSLLVLRQLEFLCMVEHSVIVCDCVHASLWVCLFMCHDLYACVRTCLSFLVWKRYIDLCKYSGWLLTTSFSQTCRHHLRVWCHTVTRKCSKKKKKKMKERFVLKWQQMTLLTQGKVCLYMSRRTSYAIFQCEVRPAAYRHVPWSWEIRGFDWYKFSSDVLSCSSASALECLKATQCTHIV